MAELDISELGPQADGIHRSAQDPVYIDRALPGEKVRADVQRGSGGVLRGELREIVTPSPDRIAAPCIHYDVCGGCSIQHASEAFYRDWKTGVVRAALAREDLSPETWLDPVFIPAATRRRATFVALKKNGRVTLGYFRRRSHQIAEITDCLIVDPAIMALRTQLSVALVPILQDGKQADIFVQVVEGRSEIVITGPMGGKGGMDLAMHEAFASLIRDAKVSRISWRTREREAPEVLLEAAPLLAPFNAITVTLPPLAFLQPTKVGERTLVDAVMAGIPQRGKFADLFSGCGTFTGAMLERGRVDAFDGNEAAVKALSKAGGQKALKAVQRDLFHDPLQADELSAYAAVVFDPPRAGALEQARVLANTEVPRVIAASCNPATFARDARILVEGGYRLETVKIVDQFLWSQHVELVAVFSR